MSEYDETSSDSGFDDSSIEESDSSNVDSFNEDTNDNSNDFEIGGHNDMSLEEVQDYQNDGWNDVEQMRGETWDEREPGAELSHQGFMDAQDKFEAGIMNDGGSGNNGNSNDIPEDA